MAKSFSELRTTWRNAKAAMQKVDPDFPTGFWSGLGPTLDKFGAFIKQAPDGEAADNAAWIEKEGRDWRKKGEVFAKQFAKINVTYTRAIVTYHNKNKADAAKVKAAKLLRTKLNAVSGPAGDSAIMLFRRAESRLFIPKLRNPGGG